MLSLRPQQQIVEKVLKNKAGGYVRAKFLLTEYNGRIHVKLLSAVPIFDDVSTFATEIVLALPSVITKTVFEQVLIHGEVIVSSFFDFNFFVSQPTRAPARSV